MATLVDLNNAVNSVLTKNFPNHKIYAGEVTEGFQRPSFFTQIMPMRMDYETKNYKSGLLMVAITFFNASDKELENIKMHDGLLNAFGVALEVNRRHFLLENIRSTRADTALQFSFDLNYLSQLTKEEEYELMKELDMRISEE